MAATKAASKRRYPRPRLAADVVLFGVGNDELQVLLISRGIAPFADMWALPGGHVEQDEDPRHTAARELTEETGLSGLPLTDLAVFGAAGRDPRGWYVSSVFIGASASARLSPVAADDATDVAWHSVRKLPELAFDHADIIARALSELGERRPPRPDAEPAVGSGPHLFLFSGATASGKSTLCRELLRAVPGAIHLDLDQIRRDLTGGKPTYSYAEAWAAHNATRSLAEWLLAQGQPVLIDVSGLTAADRAHYLASGPLFGSPTTLIWCETTKSVAEKRLKRRAAGLDPLDHSSAKLAFWIESLARRQRPTADEADLLIKVGPANHATAFAELVARLESE